NARGFRTRTTDRRGLTTTFLLDTRNRVEAVVRPDDDAIPANNPRITYQYDAASNRTQETDPLGRVTTYLVDRLNRRTGVTEALAGLVQRTTTMAYDEVGNLLAVSKPQTYDGETPAVRLLTQYSYDALNRRTHVHEAVGVPGVSRSTATAFDPAGNVLAV